MITFSAMAQSTVVDQLIATVNGEPITQSDIFWGIALDPKAAPTDELQNWMIEQYIDQSLLFDEAEHLPNLEPSEEEVAGAIADLIKKFPSETIFYQRIEKSGLTSARLREIIRRRLQILKYIDFRFRSFAIITEEEIQRYFREEYMPRAISSGMEAREKPTDQERNMIEAILIEERIDREIERFLENARQQADIVILAKF
jgi:hypothetical protein